MSNRFKAWLSATRPRTLPLSIAGILMGSGIAFESGNVDFTIFFLAILTTISFQVLSNFANDYGDAVKGTDNEHRVGPTRAIQSGEISAKAMKKGILMNAIFSATFTVLLIYKAFGIENLGIALFFLALGGFAIMAAIKYTVGNSAYGYRGLGDVFVFIFFGLVGVLGSLFLFTMEFNYLAILPAVSIGLLSVGVLNLNNMRDHEGDRLANKNTLVVLMGFQKAKIYHTILVSGGVITFTIFVILKLSPFHIFINLLPFVFLFVHLVKVWKTTEAKTLDGQLKVVALTTFLVSLIWFIIQI